MAAHGGAVRFAGVFLLAVVLVAAVVVPMFIVRLLRQAAGQWTAAAVAERAGQGAIAEGEDAWRCGIRFSASAKAFSAAANSDCSSRNPFRRAARRLSEDSLGSLGRLLPQPNAVRGYGCRCRVARRATGGRDGGLGDFHFPHGLDVLPRENMMAVANYGTSAIHLCRL